jgi:hypothetical protein
MEDDKNNNKFDLLSLLRRGKTTEKKVEVAEHSQLNSLKKVEIAKQTFLDSLDKIEENPFSQKFIDEARELGREYERLAKSLNVDINSSRNGFDRIKDISIAQFKGLQKNSVENTTGELIGNFKPNEIMVVISGNWGDIPMTLAEWMKQGPGNRVLRSPFRSWNLKTGEEIPINEIPQPFRNDFDSIKKIINGELKDPWNRDIEVLKDAVGE